MAQPEQNGRPGWIGIPSVPPQRIGQAFVSFYLAIGIATGIDVLFIVHNEQPKTWQLIAQQVFNDGGSIVAWALAATWPIMEILRMVIAGIFEKRIFRRGQEQGRKEGREETQRMWESWNLRRVKAEEQGEEFTEPPPGSSGDHGN